jgi:hypothetical protein
MFNKPVNNLPPGLETLKILGYTESGHKSSYRVCGIFDHPVDNLPPMLSALYIESTQFNQSLEYLPAGLKTLHITSERFDQSIDAIPAGVESLYIDSTDFLQPCMNLPVGLKSLFLWTKSWLYASDKLLIPDGCGCTSVKFVCDTTEEIIKKKVKMIEKRYPPPYFYVRYKVACVGSWEIEIKKWDV